MMTIPGKYVSSYPDHACGAKITCTNCSRPGNCKFSQFAPERVRRQDLTPPPMSSRLVSKFAIPRANGKFPGHGHFHKGNKLVLCEIRFIAISSSQYSGISFSHKNTILAEVCNEVRLKT